MSNDTFFGTILVGLIIAIAVFVLSISFTSETFNHKIKANLPIIVDGVVYRCEAEKR